MKNEIILNTESDTIKWAAGFAKTLCVPKTVALHGTLGMGKSVIARAIIQTLCGSDTVVPSPTFTLVQTYDADDIRISHFDLYRINDVSELEEIGLSHAIVNDITIIEWPEIATRMLPTDTIHVFIVQHGDGRKITIG